MPLSCLLVVVWASRPNRRYNEFEVNDVIGRALLCYAILMFRVDEMFPHAPQKVGVSRIFEAVGSKDSFRIR